MRFTTDIGGYNMPGTTMPSASTAHTPSHHSSPLTTSTTPTATADELFAAAFSVPRDPRSQAYKHGVLVALKFRIEGRRNPKRYDPATAEDDAYYAGQAEGHAIWRRVQAESAGAA
jgi:hypothetical protein